jgi:hypothetical protein
MGSALEPKGAIMSAGEASQDNRGLSRIPFTVATEARIKSLSFWLTLVGWINLVAGFINLIEVFSAASNAGQFGNVIVNILMGVWCLQAAAAFKKVATTDEADQAYLVKGFYQLRKIFLFQGILILIGLAFATAVLLFLIVHGVTAKSG